MIAISIRNLLEKLNPYGKSLLEGAVGSCVTRGHYEVTIAHFLNQALEEGHGDLPYVLHHFKVDMGLFKMAIQQELKELRVGNSGKPTFSPIFMGMLESAWAEASLNLNETLIRCAAVVLAIRRNPSSVSAALGDQFKLISPEILIEKFSEITASSKENAASGRGAQRQSGEKADEGSALGRFTINMTQLAKDGKMDPVFGRDDEIRQTIDILSRRRKNNPIMVGDAGVGKTAVIEGLSLKIAEGDVPDILKNVEIRSLDLGLLQAGAGVRGEFENRLKSVIKETKESAVPIILFIDEAHTLIGAGGEKGQNDAANLLKPELARGELKVLGATTHSEFRKYFEKDPAMARRFQQVRIEEPDPETASIMLRGLRTRYEQYHGVRITYEGIKAACDLSNKFIAGRQLPDKAVDLLDTAAARVKMGLTTKPPQLQVLEQSIANLKIEIEALEKDESAAVLDDIESLTSARSRLQHAEEQCKDIEIQWKSELQLVEEVIALQKKLEESKDSAEKEKVRAEIDIKWQALEAVQGDQALVYSHVDKGVVAQIISEWTGIPAGNMMKDEAHSLLELDKTLSDRVIGQPWGIREIANTIRAAKTGLGNPEAPMGVFLVTGPSGVGKTETALAISDLLFGGEKAVVTINMSEYQDSMSVTQLKGASAGYVGYGDGGVLTEGVRKRPYTVVILDEVEKAHKDVLNMFYQVFDKGILRDGEGRDINFRNALILMTSNLGLQTITDMALEDKDYTLDDYTQRILPELTDHFQPALLARCKVVPFLPLGTDSLQKIIALKLMKVGKRLMGRHKMAFAVSPAVVGKIVAQCTTLQSGARNIDTVVDQQILPEISRNLLIQLAEGNVPTHLFIGVNEADRFAFYFSQGDFDAPELRESAPESDSETEASKEEEISTAG